LLAVNETEYGERENRFSTNTEFGSAISRTKLSFDKVGFPVTASMESPGFSPFLHAPGVSASIFADTYFKVWSIE